MTKAEKARQYFKDGYNCCQAVVLAFSDELGIDDKSAMALASSFGGGFGRMREVCGAVSGMGIVAGLKYGYTSPQDNKNGKKAAHYALIQQMAKEFEEKNGSIICRVLTGIEKGSPVPEDRTPDYYKKRPCDELVYEAAYILEKVISEMDA